MAIRGQKALEDVLSRLSDRAVPAACATAVNRIASQAITRSVRRVAREKKIPVKQVKKRARLQRATSRQRLPKATVRVYRADMPAINLGTARVLGFTPGERHKGTVLKVGHHLFPGGFIQYLKTGRWQVMRRISRRRYKIEVVKIPLSGELTTAFMEESEALITEKLPEELQKAMKKQLGVMLARNG
ncbi:phage tail protein [Salmonella enterica]|nr:phage tail protein [Salmonella enterica]EHZ8201935.1 phage tail protein [Salmonella enterica]